MSLVIMAHTCKCHGDPVVWCTVSQEMWCAAEVWSNDPLLPTSHTFAPIHKICASPFPAPPVYKHEYGRSPSDARNGSRLQGFRMHTRRGRLPPAPPPTREDLGRARAIARGLPSPEVFVSWSVGRRAAINEVAGILERREKRRRKQ